MIASESVPDLCILFTYNILSLSSSYTSAWKIKDSHSAPIPTLCRDNSGIEPRQEGILTSPDKVRIPTFRNCTDSYSTQNIYCKVEVGVPVTLTPQTDWMR